MSIHIPTFDIPSLVKKHCWQLPSTEDACVFAVLLTFALLLVLEVRLGQGQRHGAARRSYLANFYTFLFNDTVMSLLSVSSLLVLAGHLYGRGLLSGVEQAWLKGFLTFVLLDLLFYGWHRANHTWDWLWRFHKVHHSDRYVNVSTAFRLHFMEVLLATLVKAAFIVAMGMDASHVAIAEAVTTLFVMFHHANISFRAERWLSRAFVMPYLHRLHHSVLRAEHDRNFGAVFSYWDRLFGTLDQREPFAIGLKYVPSMDFLELLRFGFAPNAVSNARQFDAMVAEAAYFRAEKRGFLPGFELHDWLEAEREIHSRLM